MSNGSSEYYIPDELYYFDERFSPRSLRRYQLKAILATYNISTPSHLSKSDLVKLYQDNVLSRKQEILRQYYENLSDDEDEDEEEDEEEDMPRILDEPRSTRQRTRSMRQPETMTTMTWKTSAKRSVPSTTGSRKAEPQERGEEDEEDEDEEFRLDPLEEDEDDDDENTLEDDDISDTEAFMLLHDLQTPPDNIYGSKDKPDPLATLQSYHPSFMRLLRGAYFLIAVFCMISVAIVVHARSTNGYCDTATDDDRLSLFSIPSACIPCPDHGICEHGELQCQRLYERRRPFYNPFGLLPIADECVQDSAIGKTVARLEKKIKRELRTEQGNLVCFRTVHGLTQTIGAEQIAQIKVEDIVTSIKEHEQLLLPSDTVDEIMTAALTGVLSGPHIFYWERDGKPYIGTDEPRFRLSCRARLAWHWLPARYKTIILALLASLPILLFARYHYRYHIALKRSTEEKVQTMIQMLREQREKHSADPVRYPESGLTAAQLRAQVTTAHRPGALEEWKRLSKLLAMHMEVRKSFAETNGDPTEYWEITS